VRNAYYLVVFAQRRKPQAENPSCDAYYLVILGHSPPLSSLAERSEAEDPANRATRDFATLSRRAAAPPVT
jgi:hypothetical protein